MPTNERRADVARVLVLGAGYTGAATARLARAAGLGVTTTVRSEDRASALRAEGFDVVVGAALGAGVGAGVDDGIDGTTHVVIAFPPDGATEFRIAPSLARAASSVFISTTGVYGDRRGRVDDRTPLPDAPDARGARYLDAEQAFREHGATVLRSPAIYGPDRGLHVRVLRGDHRIPGDGSRTLSRIHVEDLAALLLAARGVTAETFVVGDAEPAPHLDVVRFVCATYGVPLPESVPLGDVHDSLRADRAIDGTRALAVLGVTLRYPSYRDGMAPRATGLGAP
jgi:nucleoside-diphosphate-sugar epimerase